MFLSWTVAVWLSIDDNNDLIQEQKITPSGEKIRVAQKSSIYYSLFANLFAGLFSYFSY